MISRTHFDHMSHLRYSSYPGWGQRALERANMSQTVRIPAGEQVQISGQGGWDRTTDKIPDSLSEEISQVSLKPPLELSRLRTNIC